MKITKITHYHIDDPEFCGDYCDIELFDEAGNRIADYGDWYHDNGHERVEGFIEGVEWITGKKIKIKRIDIADRED